MLPDSPKRKADKSPVNFVQTSGTLFSGLVSIGIIVAVALLTRRSNQKNPKMMLDTFRSNGPAKPLTETALTVPTTTKSPASELPSRTAPKPPVEPYPIDIKLNRVDYAGVVISLLSLIATVVIAVFAGLISWNQAESLKEQAAATRVQAAAADAQAASAKVQSDAADADVNIKFLEEFRKRLHELSLSTESSNVRVQNENYVRKSLALIALAQYGERVLPALKMTLQVKDDDMRRGAVDVLVQMLSHPTNKDSRKTLFEELLRYFEDGDVLIKAEILRCFAPFTKQSKVLSDDDAKCAKDVFRKHVFPDADLSRNADEQEVLRGAAQFFGNWPDRDSADFLLAILKNKSSGPGPEEQARNALTYVQSNATDLPHELKEEITAFLKKTNEEPKNPNAKVRAR